MEYRTYHRIGQIIFGAIIGGMAIFAFNFNRTNFQEATDFIETFLALLDDGQASSAYQMTTSFAAQDAEHRRRWVEEFSSYNDPEFSFGAALYSLKKKTENTYLFEGTLLVDGVPTPVRVSLIRQLDETFLIERFRLGDKEVEALAPTSNP